MNIGSNPVSDDSCVMSSFITNIITHNKVCQLLELPYHDKIKCQYSILN